MLNYFITEQNYISAFFITGILFLICLSAAFITYKRGYIIPIIVLVSFLLFTGTIKTSIPYYNKQINDENNKVVIKEIYRINHYYLEDKNE